MKQYCLPYKECGIVECYCYQGNSVHMKVVTTHLVEPNNAENGQSVGDHCHLLEPLGVVQNYTGQNSSNHASKDHDRGPHPRHRLQEHTEHLELATLTIDNPGADLGYCKSENMMIYKLSKALQ